MVIIYKLLSYILVSSPNPKVVATINGAVTSTVLGSILFNFINTITR